MRLADMQVGDAQLEASEASLAAGRKLAAAHGLADMEARLDAVNINCRCLLPAACCLLPAVFSV